AATEPPIMAPPTTLQSINNSLPASFPLPNPARLRTYILRLPLFTRIMLLAILFFWILELQTVWSVIQWGSLIPNEVGFGSMYRLNTYPLVHVGFWHMLFDTLCAIPLLERFEAEWGTLNTVALFLGRKWWTPEHWPILAAKEHSLMIALYSVVDHTRGL